MATTLIPAKYQKCSNRCNYEDQAYGDIREVTLTYQTTAQYKDDFLADNGKEASAYGYSGYTIKSVNRRQVSMSGKVLRAVDDNTGSWGPLVVTYEGVLLNQLIGWEIHS